MNATEPTIVTVTVIFQVAYPLTRAEQGALRSSLVDETRRTIAGFERAPATAFGTRLEQE